MLSVMHEKKVILIYPIKQYYPLIDTKSYFATPCPFRIRTHNHYLATNCSIPKVITISLVCVMEVPAENKDASEEN